MASNEIHFNDGASYERYMGQWSRLAGQTFLDWLAPKPASRWLDTGCGNGAFTALLMDRCAPASVHGIDPSAEQLVFARSRFTSPVVQFQQGDAMALPFPKAAFDAAVMPLSIFFVPQPGFGVAEMARVVAPGGIVSAYGWDMLHGGFPYDSLWTQMRDLGVTVPMPPSVEAANIEVMQSLWQATGLTNIQTREIKVQRTFADFDDYWTTIQGGPSVWRGLKSLAPDDLTILQSRMRDRLLSTASDQITLPARANAVMGTVAS